MQYYRMHGRGLKTNPRRSFCFSLVQVRCCSIVFAIADSTNGPRSLMSFLMDFDARDLLESIHQQE